MAGCSTAYDQWMGFVEPRLYTDNQTDRLAVLRAERLLMAAVAQHASDYYNYRVHTHFEKQNSRTFQGLSMTIFVLLKDLKKWKK